MTGCCWIDFLKGGPGRAGLAFQALRVSEFLPAKFSMLPDIPGHPGLPCPPGPAGPPGPDAPP
eukprot:8908846-Karenia_brevis.AAC.1